MPSDDDLTTNEGPPPLTTRRHRYRCPMRWGDMDAQDHVNNAFYLDYLQEARVDFLLSGPIALQQLLATGVLVVSHQVEYLKPLRFGYRPLTIDLWVDAVGGSRFAIGYDVYDGEQLVARARTGAVPYDLSSNRLRRLTTEERALLSEFLDPTEPLPALPRQRVLDTDAVHRFPLYVRWSDLDSYGHVNNVKFFDYVQEARIALIDDTVGWSDGAVWLVVRQDLEYLKPMDFATTPYEVASVVSAIGNRSFRLEVLIRDPDTATVFATARTVVVGATPLSDPAREALSHWAR
ncbi:MAG: thioesterase family protein [Propionibacteriaceae bacterium]